MFTLRTCLTVLLSLLITCETAFARQSFLEEWRSIYPNSSSSRRECQLCHANSSGGQPWNGYGFDIRTRYIEIDRTDMRQAIIDIQELDSDTDQSNLSNLEEIRQSFDPGWRSPGLNFIIFSDLNFDQIVSPFNDTDEFGRGELSADFCFATVIPNSEKAFTICL